MIGFNFENIYGYLEDDASSDVVLYSWPILKKEAADMVGNYCDFIMYDVLSTLVCKDQNYIHRTLALSNARLQVLNNITLKKSAIEKRTLKDKVKRLPYKTIKDEFEFAFKDDNFPDIKEIVERDLKHHLKITIND